MPTKIVTPGVNVDAESSTQDYALGMRAFGQDGSEWIYAKQPASALAIGDVVAINQSDYTAAKITTALAAKGDKIAVCQRVTTASYYGWFLVKSGAGTSYKVRARNSCAPNVALYTSAVAGLLDDTSSTTFAKVQGIMLRDTATASGAAEEAYIPVDPHVA